MRHMLPLGLFLLLCLAAQTVQAATAAPARTATTQSATPGPLLTDAELFQALDLHQAGLEAVEAAWASNNVPAAKRELARYFRHRTSVPWRVDPEHIDRTVSFDREIADSAAIGRVKVVGVWHTFPGGQIDWFFNATRDRKDMAYDAQWQLQMGRMAFWEELGKAYWATGEEKYAHAFVSQMRSWVTQCPKPPTQENGHAGYSAWLTLDVGIRMQGCWPDAYHRFLHSPSFTDDDLLLYLKSCIEQARFVRQFNTAGNWLTMEMNGLYTVGALYPELKEAQEWRQYAAGRLFGELEAQFLPDGAQFELAPGYHNVALDNILMLADTAKVVGRAEELPAGYTARAENAFNYDLCLMTPDRSLPQFNDCWWRVNVPKELEKAAALFPQRSDFAWVASDGHSGQPPRETSHAFAWAGYYAMRSGWDRQANYLAFRAGPLGKGHVHQDKLNVALWAYGRQILFDGGGGSYEESKWRKYAIDTFSHNTVLVDGQPQRRPFSYGVPKAKVFPAAIDARWESTADHDFAQGIYDEGYGKEQSRIATHRRRVLFLKPDLFIVADMLTPNDAASHTYQARWHLLPTAVNDDLATHAVTTAEDGKSNLAVVPLLSEGLEVRHASGQTEGELLGWWVRANVDPHNLPATTVLHTRQGTGVQRFLTLLVPLKPGMANPVRSVRQRSQPGHPDTIEVVMGDGGLLQLEVEWTEQGGIRATQVNPDGTARSTVVAGQTGAK